MFNRKELKTKAKLVLSRSFFMSFFVLHINIDIQYSIDYCVKQAEEPKLGSACPAIE